MPRGGDSHFLLLKLPDLPEPGPEGWDGPEGWKLLEGGKALMENLLASPQAGTISDGCRLTWQAAMAPWLLSSC